MKKFFIQFLHIFFISIVFSCSNNDQITGLSGMYVGNICYNTALGMVSHITFEKSGRLAATVRDFDDENINITTYGMWKFEKGVVCISIAGNTLYCKQLSLDEVVMTDRSGRPKEWGNSQCVFFREDKKLSSHFSGIYTLEGCEEDGYIQTLHLKPITGDSLEVNISFTGAMKGCEFTGKGYIINNQIEVDLSDYGSHIASTMVLNELDDNKISIITSRYEDRFDLTFFCGNGASLGGRYFKEN